MTRIITALAVATSLGTFAASQATASPITLDFTSPAYGSITGHQNAQVVDQGLTLSFSSNAGSSLTATSHGIGVASLFGDDSEIGCGLPLGFGCIGLERLGINLSTSTTLYSIGFQQFFPNEFFTSDEEGTYSINGGAPVTFSALNANGLLTISFGPNGISNVNSLSFSIPGGTLSDYSVANISVEGGGGRGQTLAPVPEPGTLILLGSGLAGVAARARKRFARK